MATPFMIMAVSGYILFIVGGAARTYMNILIERSGGLANIKTRSTERKYLTLIRESGAPVWPFAVAVICMPLGMAVAFASIILNNLSSQ